MIRHGPAANDERTISRTGEFLGVLQQQQHPIIAIPLDTHDRFAHHHRHHHMGAQRVKGQNSAGGFQKAFNSGTF